MLGLLLALALQQPCQVISFTSANTVMLACGEEALEIPFDKWPEQWEGPHLGATYSLDTEGRPLPTRLRPGLREEVYQRSRAEQGRWKRAPMQAISP